MVKNFHQTKIRSQKLIPYIAIAFILCFVFWFYMLSTSEMVIAHDAQGYEELGKMIFEKGWGEYFVTGPNREPFYPFTVAVCMMIGKALGLSYQVIQMFFQITIIAVTQFLILLINRKLKVPDIISAFAILYFGLSPAIINSALRLFSEIITYPFMLGIILIYMGFIKSIASRGLSGRSIALMVLWALNLVLLTLTKGIFQLITPLLVLLVVVFLMKQKIRIQNILILLIIFFISYYVPITAYKGLNKKFNGQFMLTDRGGGLLYGHTARRVDPMSPKRLGAALAYVPSFRFCNAIYGQEQCDHWSFKTGDDIAAQKSSELPKALSQNQVYGTFIKLALQKIFENPLQYLFLTAVENCKIVFWESPSMQYVVYPSAWIKFIAWKPINISLFVVMPFLTVLALIYSFIVILRDRSRIFVFSEDASSVFLMLFLVVVYSLTHSLFLIIDRYTFPLVPFYLILISYFMSRVVFRRVDNEINAKQFSGPIKEKKKGAK